MDHETATPPLIQTKLHHPRIPQGLIDRPNLPDHLNARRDRTLPLISALAGCGKTSLLVQWLNQAPHPATWLLPEEHDNDLTVFLGYFIAAIRTLFTKVCPVIRSLQTVTHLPSNDEEQKGNPAKHLPFIDQTYR